MTNYRQNVDAGGILQSALLDFHRKYQHFVSESPASDIPTGVLKLRIDLINEEVNRELIPALQKLSRCTTEEEWLAALVDILDGAVDSVYVILGTLVSLGLPFGPAFAEVHRSNMTKTAPEGEVDPSQKYGVKTPKGADYIPPSIRGVILMSKNSAQGELF